MGPAASRYVQRAPTALAHSSPCEQNTHSTDKTLGTNTYTHFAWSSSYSGPTPPFDRKELKMTTAPFIIPFFCALLDLRCGSLRPSRL